MISVSSANADKTDITSSRLPNGVPKVRTVSSHADDETVMVSGRIPNGVIEQVAKEIGYTTGTIKNAVSLARQVGRDNLKVMAGTSLASQSEIQAVVQLKQEAPEEAERCITLARGAKEKGFGRSWLGHHGFVARKRRSRDAPTVDHYNTSRPGL